MCLRNNAEDRLNHLKKIWETIQGSKWKSGILITWTTFLQLCSHHQLPSHFDQ